MTVLTSLEVSPYIMCSRMASASLHCAVGIRLSRFRLTGGKRPFHTIIPAFMERGEDHIGFGIMGGAVQPTAHAQFVSNIVDYKTKINYAASDPRADAFSGAGTPGPIRRRIP